MIRQLQAVALSYLTRRMMWLIAVLVAIYAINLLGGDASSPQTVRVSAQFFIGFPAGLIAMLTASQSKWHFVNARARLMPHFAASHLAVLCLLVIGGLGVVPYACALATGLNPIGAAACTVAIAASFTWALHVTRLLPNLIALALFFSLMSEPAAIFWLWPAAAPRYWHLHMGILLLGWMVEAAWIYRLATMTEEDDDYNIPIAAQSGSATRMEREFANRNMARYLTRSGFSRIPVDLWHDRLQHIKARTTAARQSLLRYGFTPLPAWLQVGVMALLFFAGFFYMMFGAMGLAADGDGIAPTMAMVVLIMPVMVPANLLPMRRARMAHELIWPLSRRQYIDGLLGAAMKQCLAAWLIITGAMIALLAVRSVEIMSFEFIAAFTALTLSVQVGAFGFMTWAARYSSAIGRVALMTVILIPMLFGGGVGMKALALRSAPSPPHPAVYRALEQDLPPAERERIERHIERHEQHVRESRETKPGVAWRTAAALAAVGVVGIWFSRRQWLQMELG